MHALRTSYCRGGPAWRRAQRRAAYALCVSVLLEPTAKQKDAAEKRGEASDARWIPGRVIDTGEDDAGAVIYTVYLKKGYDGGKQRLTQNFPRERVRAGENPTTTFLVSPQKTVQPDELPESFEDAIENGYDPVNWPLGLIIWHLYQCTKRAQE